MKIISITAPTGGGKTTLARALRERLPRACSLHFDDYTFEGEVDDFAAWVRDDADYHVWNLRPLEEDIIRIKESGNFDYLLLDYPFARCHKQLNSYIDCAIYINTPLDVTLARQILRDFADADANAIRRHLAHYLEVARPAYLLMPEQVLPSADHAVDGTKTVRELVEEVLEILASI